MDKNITTLLEFNRDVKKVIQCSFPSSLWISAEIGEIRVNHNGHCYLDLVEKDPGTGTVVARVKAIIWVYTFRMLKSYFETTTGQPLSAGLRVLVQAEVEFQEVFGLSLVIKDIDPGFTIGDLQRHRQIVIARLEKEGVMWMNKELPLPLFPQRIAVISSPTAAGYGDFVIQMESNPGGLKFYHKLFPAIMQGENAPASITSAFNKIFEHVELFDVVVLTRGGGASLDLLCFDDYRVAYHITQFPLPVITGIGHERDSTVADTVAHTNLHTPTAVANFLINSGMNLLNRVNGYPREMKLLVNNKIAFHKSGIDKLEHTCRQNSYLHIFNYRQKVQRLSYLYKNKVDAILGNQLRLLDNAMKMAVRLPSQVIGRQNFVLSNNISRLKIRSGSSITTEKQLLTILDNRNKGNDPVLMLQKGYTITRYNGKIIKEKAILREGDLINTLFKDGDLQSKVI